MRGAECDEDEPRRDERLRKIARQKPVGKPDGSGPASQALIALMDEASKKRELAQRCRDMAEAADIGTAANLRMLATDYEAEAAKLDADRPPPLDRRHEQA